MIKDRPITPLLAKQMKRQSERLKQCGQQAYSVKNTKSTWGFLSDTGTFYSNRLPR